MARIRYGVYLLEANHCYVITNTENDYAETDTDDAYLNPGIQMSLLAHNDSALKKMFSTEYYDDPEYFRENLIQVVQGRLPGWKLSGVNIAIDGIYLIYHYISPHSPTDNTLWNTGTIFVFGKYNISFTVNCGEGQPIKRYDLSVNEEESDKTSRIQIICITEFIDGHKIRKLEMRSDNHNKPTPNGQQYCIITEY